MASRIRIKMGDLEVEYEGDEGFLRDGLLSFLESLADLSEQRYFPESDYSDSGTEITEKPEVSTGIDSKIQLSPSTVAARLKVQSGSELILAAAAHLTFVQGRDTFSRQQITETMRMASGYYNVNISKNLTGYLKTLVKNNKLNGLSNNRYSLSVKTRKELEARIAQ